MAEGRQRILLETLDRGVRADEAIDRLRRALPGATFTSIDEATGVLEIEVEASDLEDGVGQVFDAIARAGADDQSSSPGRPTSPATGCSAARTSRCRLPPRDSGVEEEVELRGPRRRRRRSRSGARSVMPSSASTSSSMVEVAGRLARRAG